MERLTRSFSTTSVDINKAWRSKVYDGKVDGSPDHRKDMKTARFGESQRGRFSKIKKLFSLDRAEQQESKKSKLKSNHSSKTSGSRDEFESRLMFEIYKNMSASHELASVYN